jgi:dTDP-4-dehydrorhamnose reductase
VLSATYPLYAVVNSAAISSPLECEKDPERAYKVNVPTQLVRALQQYYSAGDMPYLVHLSTDQVYDGTGTLYEESHPTEYLNVYGDTKRKAEALIKSSVPRHALLRSAVIYGPYPPFSKVSKNLFLQFLHKCVSTGTATQFFRDEWRSPVWVQDVASVIVALLASRSSGVFNVGGPERLSRLDMARAVAVRLEKNQDCIIPASAASCDRGFPSPVDSSMDSSLVQATLHLQFSTFRATCLDLGVVPQ